MAAPPVRTPAAVPEASRHRPRAHGATEPGRPSPPRASERPIGPGGRCQAMSDARLLLPQHREELPARRRPVRHEGAAVAKTALLLLERGEEALRDRAA